MSNAREVARRLIEGAERDEWQALEDAITAAIQDAIGEAAAEEREACAKMAETHYIPGHSVAGPGYAAILARYIRERGKAAVE